MKIIHFITSLANGGAEKFSVELSNIQSESDDVILCSLKKIEDWMLPPKKLQAAVKLLVLNIQRKISAGLVIKLIAVLRKEKPAVVHVHSAILMFYFAFLSPLFKRIKFVQTVHNTLTPAYTKLFDFLEKIPPGKKRFTHVCIAKSIYDGFSGSYPGFEFARIDNGIFPLQRTVDSEDVRSEISRLKFAETTRVFAAIGNYSPLKNFPMLVKVFTRLHEEKQNVILLVIGEDTTPGKSRYLEVRDSKGENSFLLGRKQNVGDYLSCADALVLSSTMEGMPLVVLEAFSLGLPVIATPAGGVADMVEDKKNGFTAKDFSEEEMYKAMLKFLDASEKDIAAIKKQNKKEFKEKYSISICKKKYDELYRS